MESSPFLKKVNINNEPFFIDYRYPMIRELVSPDFEKYIATIENYFLEDNKRVKKAVETALNAGAMQNVASGCLLVMTAFAIDDKEMVRTLARKLYELHPNDLLARCTYLNNNLMENNHSDESLELIATVFENTFDLDKIVTQRTIPLITFTDFMSLSITYFLYKGDDRFTKQLIYLVAGAPNHEATDAILDMFATQAEEAGVPAKDIETMYENIFDQAEKISEPLPAEFFAAAEEEDYDHDCSDCAANPEMAEWVQAQRNKRHRN